MFVNLFVSLKLRNTLRKKLRTKLLLPGEMNKIGDKIKALAIISQIEQALCFFPNFFEVLQIQ